MIDLRDDTVTQPTDKMRMAARDANGVTRNAATTWWSPDLSDASRIALGWNAGSSS